MSDIYQAGNITTINILGKKWREKIECDLIDFSEYKKTTVLIPVLYSDFVRPAMKNILKVLEEVKFIHQVILSLDKATKKEFLKVREEVEKHPLNINILWMDNPKLKGLLGELKDSDFKLGPEGKGKACWTAFGLILAQGDSNIIALHDSDIKTYTKRLLCRLIYPLMNPNLPFEFSKGFYARFSDKLHGRVVRLFVVPLFKALLNVLGNHHFISYLQSFRYPLSGEFAIRTNLARIMRFPGDWGLEVSVLYEVYRNITHKRIAQVELTHRYDHKHQDISKRDSSKGLHKMAIDIATNVLKNIAAEGIIISEGVLRTIQKNYLKIAQNLISSYHAISMMNDLKFHRHKEEGLVEVFYRALITSSNKFLEDPMGVQMLPNWNRITSAYPGFLGKLKNVFNEDNDMKKD